MALTTAAQASMTTTAQEMYSAAAGIRSRASALEHDHQQFSGDITSMVGFEFDGAAARAGIDRAREIIDAITTATRNMRTIAGIVESFAGHMEWAERLERIATATLNAVPAGPAISQVLQAIQLIGKSIDAACALSIEAACFGSQHLPHRLGDFLPSALGRTRPDGAVDLDIDDIHTIQACRAPDPLLAHTVDHPDLRLLEVSDKHWAGMVGPPPEETDNLVVFVPGVGSDGNDSIGGQIDRARTQAARWVARGWSTATMPQISCSAVHLQAQQKPRGRSCGIFLPTSMSATPTTTSRSSAIPMDRWWSAMQPVARYRCVPTTCYSLVRLARVWLAQTK